MKHRHRTTCTLLAVFFLLAVGNFLIIYTDVRFYFSGFAANANATNTTAVATICIDHPPSITSISTQTANVNSLFTLQVVASDRDTSQTLTYSDNVAEFDINPSTGLIEFTPTSANTTIQVTITVQDSSSCPGNNATASFDIKVKEPIIPENIPTSPDRRRRARVGPFVTPPPPLLQVPAPAYILKITEIMANDKLIYSYDQNIRLAEFTLEPNTITDLKITVRNLGFYPLTDVLLSLIPSGSFSIISLNPEGYGTLDTGKDAVFIAQVKIGEESVKLTIKAVADQDTDTEVVDIVPAPMVETPTFGIQIPGWIPMIITIPLLFLLGYSVWSNREAIRQLLQNLLGFLLALLARRSYFLDEDMLRTLVKEKRFNKLLHQYVIVDVYERYKDVHKNLRTIELAREAIGKINNLTKVYKVSRELAMLIVMSEQKPKPRIMTQTPISDKLKQDFKRILFYNPLQKKAASGTDAQETK